VRFAQPEGTVRAVSEQKEFHAEPRLPGDVVAIHRGPDRGGPDLPDCFWPLIVGRWYFPYRSQRHRFGTEPEIFKAFRGCPQEKGCMTGGNNPYRCISFQLLFIKLKEAAAVVAERFSVRVRDEGQV
jgi:hypothetical protein